MNITDTKTIVDFLRGVGTDHIMRTYDDMLSIDDYEMEKCHDQIQWLFPLHEFSKHASVCPIVSPETIKEAIKYKEVLNNLLRGKERLERFLTIGEYEDVDKQRRWCRKHNHNLLRVTRAIRCLRLFGLDDAAEDLWRKARVVGDRLEIGEFTLSKWDQAYTNNIWDTLQD